MKNEALNNFEHFLKLRQSELNLDYKRYKNSEKRAKSEIEKLLHNTHAAAIFEMIEEYKKVITQFKIAKKDFLKK